ncbi:Soluble pyridine nucleotide transhydrogenase [Zhongshania aliphaticivorans]|uniref:Soluble pyridine nucleotide transhydrogenase n=1 Tax=Zhongshania aliphaticivorans TaxID=1470434 RepID=A0A5S9Q4Y6_9GAMM|nr:Si-specific NAD(P)(+) transhydrogenase [Zhongshania aliphaticivorans]CAA0095027.1 Soluble pyridine nucleotide transhydrogenase [Zhongshania aliphaticivorans]CAA0112818.1 Soluble pyridine nucleotide transhydrogenase [Zhongshania aliphaticivorans]
MTTFDYDVLVLGSGPAGESAALNAMKHGHSVAIIEAQSAVGGACTHQGTIPSKALRHMVRQAIRYNKTPAFRDIGDPRTLTYPRLLSHANEVISRQVNMRSRFYYRNQIKVIFGHGRFVDKNTVEVLSEEGQVEALTAARVVIATGSRPYRPDNIDFSHPRVYDSDTILKMVNTPAKLIIYGAGVIGCEYASIFSGIGIKIELINSRDRLLEFLDDEISDALSYQLRNMGVMIRHREVYKTVEASDSGVEILLESGKRIHANALLWCNGRSGNTQQIGLENIGLETDHRGQLVVDEHYQTAVPGVYAAGDVIGWPSLASAAYDQGRSAAAHARGKEQCRFVDDVPTGIYTLPEISSVGRTERELTEAKVPYEVGRAFFKDTARGQISGETVGMLKLLFHPDTLEILGIHCFGAEAAEIIHIGQAIMKQENGGNTLRYFVTTTFNYPTMAEAYRTAALNGLNRL